MIGAITFTGCASNPQLKLHHNDEDTHSMTHPDFTELYNLLRTLHSHLKLPRFRFHINPATHLDIFYVSETNTLQLHYKASHKGNIYIGYITSNGILSHHFQKPKISIS